MKIKLVIADIFVYLKTMLNALRCDGVVSKIVYPRNVLQIVKENRFAKREHLQITYLQNNPCFLNLYEYWFS